MSTALKRLLSFKEATIAYLILVVGALCALFVPNFLTGSNLVNILAQSAVVGIMAIGMTLVIISGGGGIDLSAGSIL
ncbi:MAG: ABC transporter permease, partial [Planctomycetota bacterium]|nr:ABC transporter permease [Planctomycetota bacterium]